MTLTRCVKCGLLSPWLGLIRVFPWPDTDSVRSAGLKAIETDFDRGGWAGWFLYPAHSTAAGDLQDVRSPRSIVGLGDGQVCFPWCDIVKLQVNWNNKDMISSSDMTGAATTPASVSESFIHTVVLWEGYQRPQLQPFHSQEWWVSNFPCSLTRNTTLHSMENSAFRSLLRWKIILYYQFSLGECTFWTGEWSISNFPCSLTRNTTLHSMENSAFRSLLRWKIILYYQFSLGECTFWTG